MKHPVKIQWDEITFKDAKGKHIKVYDWKDDNLQLLIQILKKILMRIFSMTSRNERRLKLSQVDQISEMLLLHIN